MGAGYFDPHSTACGPCWHCTHFERMLYEGSAARCGLPKGSPVRALPADGCAFYERVPGVDDEPGPPGGLLPVPENWRTMMSRTMPRSLYEPGRHPLTEGG